MKKIVRYFAVMSAVIMLICSFATSVFAKDLEPCYHCNGKGEYHCSVCNNKGEFVCKACGGARKTVCPGADGEGKCNNGWYVCPSCHGDGKCRTGDGEIAEGVCGNCADSGKLGYIRCIFCHGAGKVDCHDCNGTGKCGCQVGECIKARAVGYKCPYCMGAGYMLTNFWPGENDGKQNSPEKGDKIWVDGKSTVYGGESGQSGNNSQSGGKQTETNPLATSDTEPKTTTEPKHTETTSAVEPSPEITVQLPKDRTTDFSLTENQNDGKKPTASAAVEMAKMSEKESEYYAALSDEELGRKLTNVQKIVSTAKPGKFEDGFEKALGKIAEQNGLSSLEEGRILPIYFEGHENVGFPVKVSVTLDKGVMDGGSDLFMYHITEAGSVEELGKTEYSTYDDGSIETIHFFTTGFSSFFTSKKQLDVEQSEKIFAENVPAFGANTDNGNKENNNRSIYILVGILAAVVVIGVPAAVIIRKRKIKG